MTAKRLLIAVILSCLTLPGASPAAAADGAAGPTASATLAAQGAARPGQSQDILDRPAALPLSSLCGDCPPFFDTPTVCENKAPGSACGSGKTCRLHLPMVHCPHVSVTHLHCYCA